MATLYLFRLRLELPPQVDAFKLAARRTPRHQILEAAVREFPAREDGWGHIWHIGDLEKIDPGILFFRFGKVTDQEYTTYDEESKRFIARKARPTPTSDVIFHIPDQLAAVTFERELGRTAKSVGNRLRDLLAASDPVEYSPYTLSIHMVIDPVSFLKRVRGAYAIRTFTFWFGRPNLPDEADLTNALQEFTQELDGYGGRTVISGDSLDPRPVERVTREALASGEDVSAKIETGPADKGETIHARDDNPKTVEAGPIDTAPRRWRAARAVLEAFRRLRRGE